MRILPKVTAKLSENLSRLKGNGFLATFVSKELVDPKAVPNWAQPNRQAG